MPTQPNKAANDDEVNACMLGWPLAGLFSCTFHLALDVPPSQGFT
jgi:hypothetical protein